MTQEEEELPTAAKVRYGSVGMGEVTHVNVKHPDENLQKGDELVRRQDIEQRINELREKWPDDKAIRQLLEEVQKE